MSPKQSIRLWFEFYRLALKDPAFKNEVRRSLRFYEPWGDVEAQSFDRWWLEHKHLFEQTHVSQITRIGKESDALYLAVPLQQPLTRTMQQLRAIISKRLVERSKSAGIQNRRMKAAGIGTFHLTPGVEFRHSTVNQALLVYRDVYLKNRQPKVNAAFLEEVQAFFRSRPRAKDIPNQLATSLDSPDIESTLTSIRRYIRRARSLMKAAAVGDFPGKSRMGSKN